MIVAVPVIAGTIAGTPSIARRVAGRLMAGCMRDGHACLLLRSLPVPVCDGAGDATDLDLLDAHLDAVLHRHRPDLVFYPAGADAFAGDRLGRLAMTFEGLAARDACVFERCRRRGIPVAVAMGGGYAHDVDDIVRIHAQTVREAGRWHSA